MLTGRTKKNKNNKGGKTDPVAEGLRKDYPNHRVSQRKGSSSDYTLTNKNTGQSVGVSRSPAKKDPKRVTTKQAVSMSMNKKKKK
jgi:hypothetical protein